MASGRGTVTAPVGDTLRIDAALDRPGFRLEVAVTAEPDEVVAVLGPNGSGKSTLLGLVSGDIDPTDGVVRIGAHELSRAGERGVPPAARGVGLLGQRALLFPHLSVLENVAFGPRAQGRRAADARAAAAEWLERVGLADFAARRPSELSGGQQQRAALARVLAARPRVLLLDEPFAALDVEAAVQMRRLVREQRAALGVPMLLVTHDPVDVVVLADRAIVLDAGRVVDEGSVTDVLGAPRTPFAAALAGVNLLAGRVADDGSVRLRDGLVLHPSLDGAGVGAGDEVSVSFAPSAVRVRGIAAGGGDANDAGANDADRERHDHWRGVVSSLEPVRGGVRVVCDEHPGVSADLPTASALAQGVEPGVVVHFAIEVRDITVRAERHGDGAEQPDEPLATTNHSRDGSRR
nr:ABC transporter ATP-binding protein [Pseudoclavibacter chungangensis]